MFEIGNWYKLGLLWHVPESNNYTHIGDMMFPKTVGCILKRWGPSGRVTIVEYVTGVENRTRTESCSLR